MRNIFFLVLFLLSNSLAAQDTFLLYDLTKGELISFEGDIHTRESPCSTFKIVLALMGYETDLLTDKNTPKIDFKEIYLDGFNLVSEKWRQAQTPLSWMQYSCVWYSQEMTKKMGVNRFREASA